MPTRIILREPPELPRYQSPQQAKQQQQNQHRDASQSTPPPPAPVSRASSASGGSAGGGGHGSSPAPRFGLTRATARSLSARNLPPRDDDAHDANADDDHRRHRQDEQALLQSITAGGHLSRRDIIASPRLVGYLFNFVASLICVVSAVMFERKSLPGTLNVTQSQQQYQDGIRRRRGLEVVSQVPPLSSPSITNGSEYSAASASISASAPSVVAMLHGVAIVGGPGPTLWYDPYGIRLMQELLVNETDGSGNPTMADENSDGDVGNATTNVEGLDGGNVTGTKVDDVDETDGSGNPTVTDENSDGDVGNATTNVEGLDDGNGTGTEVDANITDSLSAVGDEEELNGGNVTSTEVDEADENMTDSVSAVGALDADSSNATDRSNATTEIGSSNATNGTANTPPPSVTNSNADSESPSFPPTTEPTTLPTTEPTAPSTQEPTITNIPTIGTTEEILASDENTTTIICPPTNASLLPNGTNGMDSNSTSMQPTFAPNCYTPAPSSSAPPSSAPTDSASPTSIPTSNSTVDNYLGCTTDCGIQVLPKNAVTYWKMWAAIIVPAAGCVFTLAIVLAHLDTILFPNFWRETFQDGSVRERYVIFALVAYWIGGLYVCTSVNSVGYVQANVYFSAWAAFCTALMTWKLWREGAEKRNLLEILSNHARLTTYNWFWTFIFSLITLLSTSGLYAESLNPSSAFGRALARISASTWTKNWILTSVTTSMALFIPLINHALTRPQTDQNEFLRTFRIIFRQVEGIGLLALIGIWAYVITSFTGINAAINGINNPYFGTWGTFFACILTFGSWLRDKKNVSWISTIGHDVEESILATVAPRRSMRQQSERAP